MQREEADYTSFSDCINSPLFLSYGKNSWQRRRRRLFS